MRGGQECYIFVIYFSTFNSPISLLFYFPHSNPLSLSTLNALSLSLSLSLFHSLTPSHSLFFSLSLSFTLSHTPSALLALSLSLSLSIYLFLSPPSLSLSYILATLLHERTLCRMLRIALASHKYHLSVGTRFASLLS
jgi:hypothetical protein